MNGMLIDTNIIIYLSRRELELDTFVTDGSHLYISVITYMEALGFQFRSKQEEQTVREICNQFETIGLDEDIVDTVITIKQNKRIKLPDAIIVATALNSKLDLVTANVDDFKNIDDSLRVINPTKQA